MELSSDYINETPHLAPFFRDQAKQIFDAPPTARPWEANLINAMRTYQEGLGSNPPFQGNEAVIMTGQQPGLLTGPLYTVYKAITAIKLADQLQTQHGVPCVPIFWVASDDHDFEEAHATHLLTKNHVAKKVRYAPTFDVSDIPMGSLPLEDSLHALIDDVAEAASGSDCKAEVATFLHESLAASTSFAGWTAQILARLFRATPLLMFTPEMPEARRIAQRVIDTEIHQPLKSTRLINEAGQRLNELGYIPQLVKGETDCNFFLLHDGRRHKVVYEGNQFQIPAIETTYSQEEMLSLLARSPEAFSPNVALRCVVQQALFPATAYVAGPGEISYWAQLKPVFEHFSQDMPFVYPRARCTLTTIKLNKILKKLNLTTQDLAQAPDALLDKVLRQGPANPALDAVRNNRTELEAASEALRATLEAHAKKVGSAPALADTLHQQLASGLDKIEQHILQSDKARLDTLHKQLSRVTNTLAPERKPQERYYTIFSYLFEYGWDLVPRLLQELDITSFEMNQVEL